MPADNVTGDVVDELKKGIDAMIERRMSNSLATKDDIVGELQAYGKYIGSGVIGE